LLSMVQMPKGLPGSTLAIGEECAINASLLVATIIGINDTAVKKKINQLRLTQTRSVKRKPK